MYYETPLSGILKSLLPPDRGGYIQENFINDSDELVLKDLKKTKQDVLGDAKITLSRKNKEIITALYRQGIFRLKNAVNIISQDLGISRNTVYPHIRSLDEN
jgi:predicted transcriptional regulator YheO